MPRLENQPTNSNTLHGEVTKVSLRKHLTDLYGDNTAQRARKLTKLECKGGTLANQLTFLKRCRDNNVIPKGIRTNHILKSNKADNIYSRANMALLRHTIASVRSDISRVQKEITAIIC